MTTHQINPNDSIPDMPESEPDGTTTTGDHARRLQLLVIDPTALGLRRNIRTEPRLDKAFIGHIKDHGVLVPIVVRRDPNGDLIVHTGHRRTLAAIRAGLTEVPVVVLPDTAADETAAQIVRIVEQLGENQHRDAITDLDEVGAHQQLLDLGLSARQIARRTRTSSSRVTASLAVAAAPTAKEAMARLSLTLDQAAVLAEFDDDPDAVTRLSEVAGTPRFDHLAQQLRDRREEHRLRAELTTQLTSTGVTIVERPDTLLGGPLRRLTDLRPTPDHRHGQELTIGEHTSCPGHVAWLEYAGSWRPLPERMYPVYACTDWHTNGHAERYAPAGQLTEPGHTGRTGPMSEQKKTERREVITNNKAWDSATTVRRTWLREFLTRRTAPNGAATFIAQTLAGCGHELRRALEHSHPLAFDLLGQTDPKDSQTHLHGNARTNLVALAGAASAGRATVITLAMLLAALEDATSRFTWRNPNEPARLYFNALRSWGYPLSEVEQLVLQAAEPIEPGPDTAEHTTQPADLIA